MYRENRIGPNMLFDPTEATFTPTLLVGVLTASTQSAPVCKSATVPAEYNTIHMAHTPLSIATSKALSIGVPINGAHFGQLPNMFTIVGQASWVADQDLHGSFGFGMSDSSTIAVSVSAESNIMTKFNQLPTYHSGQINQAEYCSCKESLLSGGFSTDGTEVTNPHIAFFRLVNNSGGTATMVSLQVSLSVHKYLGSIDTYDPSRS